jgi:ABC-type nitrate/sulfonate/bicarbonate transport system permease component
VSAFYAPLCPVVALFMKALPGREVKGGFQEIMANKTTEQAGALRPAGDRRRLNIFSGARIEQGRTVGYNILSLVVVLFLWTLLSEWQQSIYFPAPRAIGKAFVGLITKGDIEGINLLSHIWQSLLRIIAGFGAACLIGIPLGLLMGLYPKLYNWTRSISEPVRFIPPIAWIPIAIVLLAGFTRYIFLIWLGAFFPIFITTLRSVARVNPVHINVVTVFGASRFYKIRKIIVPSVLPDIVTGMRVGLGIAWMCIVAAEMIGGEMVGLGRLILKYAELQRMSEIVVGMLTIGTIGFGMNELFIIIEKKLFRWRQEISLG